MHVEHVHEHADLEGTPLEPGVIRLFHGNDAAVGRRQHETLPLRCNTRRVAEELQHEQADEPQGRSPGPTPHGRDDHGDDHRAGQERPALTGDDGIRPRGLGWRGNADTHQSAGIGYQGSACLRGTAAERLPIPDPRHPIPDKSRNQFRLLSTSLLALIQGIMSRSFSPTTSMGCSAVRRRRAVISG